MLIIHYICHATDIYTLNQSMSLLNPVAAVARVKVLFTKTVCPLCGWVGCGGGLWESQVILGLQVVCQLFLRIRSKALEEWTSEGNRLL